MVKLLIKRVGIAGVFMLELLIVMAILVILATASFFAYQGNLHKSIDGKRKTDLYTIAQVLEEYEKDNEAYPPSLPQCNTSSVGSPLDGYIARVPCDPKTGQNYVYEVGPSQSVRTWYRIYSRLQVSGDPDIAELGCQAGCGPGNAYNYYVSSPNSPGLATTGFIPSPPPTPTTGPTNTPTATPTPSGPTPTPTPTPVVNLLANPGIESGAVIWNGWGPRASVVSTEFHSGVNAAQLVEGVGTVNLEQIVSVTANQTYLASGWIKTQLTTGTARITLFWRDASGATISPVTIGSVLSGVGNWTLQSSSVTAPPNAASARFRLTVANGSTGMAWFDDLSLQ